MPDIINSSFDPRLPFPLDVRQQVQDMNALFAIPATSRWEGMVVYVRGAEIPYILKGGVTNSFWVPFQFNSGGGLLPNGIVIYGESQQSGNDILLNDAWVWRIDQVDYQSSDDVITIAPAAAGNVRVDIIVGDNLSNFVLVTGTEVASPGPAIEPNIPADTVPLLRVEVNDTGITAFEDFALSAFVRFDINNQGLIPSQRLNARTNIQAVSKDTDDTRIGTLANTGTVSILSNEGSTSLSGPLISLNTGEDGTASFDMLSLLNTSGGGITVQKRGSTDIIGKGDSVTDYFILRLRGSDTLVRVEANNNGILANQRSSGETYLTRRDENYLTYPVSISGTGKLNDVALANGVGAIKFSSGVTEVSGIDPNGDAKELFIWSDNPDGITLPAQDTDSIAANRYLREVNVPYQTWVKTVYDPDLARWVNSNTGELQETDARYFEVTSDVLTLKYILPDIAALQAFVRGPAVLAYVSDSLRGGYFNYVAEVDFVGTADFGISFPAQDGGYWVRRFEGDYVFPEWFGALGDGVNDDTSFIQSAIDSASTLGIKNVTGKNKDYLQTATINIKDNVNIDLKGGKITINVKNLDQFSAVGVDNWSVNNTILVGNNYKDESIGNVGNSISIDGCNNWYVSKNTFEKHSRAGVYVSSSNKSSSFSIEENLFFDGYMPTPKNDFTGRNYVDIQIAGDELDKNIDFQITGNKLLSSNDSGIEVSGGNEDFIITDNISKNHVRHGIVGYRNRSGKAIISGNNCSNNGWVGIYLNEQITGAGNQDLGKTTISSNNCYANGYTDAHASGETFDVFRAGISIYSAGQVVIDSNIVGGNVNAGVDTNAHGIISNLTRQVTITNNVVYGNDGYGIRFTSGVQAGYANDNLCDGNFVIDCGLDGISINGINKSSASGRNNNITNNYVEDCKNHGIFINAGGLSNVSGNVCKLNYWHGIYVLNSIEINVTNNTCLNNRQDPSPTFYDGIYVLTTDGVYVNGNVSGNDPSTTGGQRKGVYISNSTKVQLGINTFFNNTSSTPTFISTNDSIKRTQSFSDFEVLSDGATSISTVDYDRYITNNTTTTGITSINSSIEDGRTIIVKIGDNNTTVNFDTGVNLDGNNGKRWYPKEGDTMICTIEGGRWSCVLSDPSFAFSYTEFEPLSDGATSISDRKFNRFITSNTTATTIQSINSTYQDGTTVFLKINDSNTTIKFSGVTGNLIGNNGVDWEPLSGDILIATFDATNTEWNCLISSSNITTSGATGSRPTTTSIGFRYFDTTLGKPIWYDGTNWVDATGTTV